MTMEAAPSSTGAFNWWLRNTPKKATTRPTSAAESSKRTVNRLGSLLWWMAVMVLRPLRDRLKVFQATLNEMLSNTNATASTT